MNGAVLDQSAGVVAVAIDDRGRYVFVSLDRHEFFRVTHFPASLAEAESLLSGGEESAVTHEQLVAIYGGALTLVPMDLEAGGLSDAR